jgi:hypothetical protein
MRLRTDYKYALIDQYTTYWNAFDNTEEFYGDVIGTDEAVFKYTLSKTKKVIGIDGLVSQCIYDQNSLWIVYYNDRKEALEAIDNIDKSKVVQPLADRRYEVQSRIVSTARTPRL